MSNAALAWMPRRRVWFHLQRQPAGGASPVPALASASVGQEGAVRMGPTRFDGRAPTFSGGLARLFFGLAPLATLATLCPPEPRVRPSHGGGQGAEAPHLISAACLRAAPGAPAFGAWARLNGRPAPRDAYVVGGGFGAPVSPLRRAAPVGGGHSPTLLNQHPGVGDGGRRGYAPLGLLWRDSLRTSAPRGLGGGEGAGLATRRGPAHPCRPTRITGEVWGHPLSPSAAASQAPGPNYPFQWKL